MTKWIDYSLPTGQDFSVGICGYSGKVRHMFIGDDPIRKMVAQYIYAEEGYCQTGDHCLALDCPLNRAEPEHLLHMLDMNEDEPLDEEASEQWGTKSTLQGFILFARQITNSLSDDLKKPQPPVEE